MCPTASCPPRRRTPTLAGGLLLGMLSGVSMAAAALPEWLGQTGLYRAGTYAIADNVIAFSPQYPLWADGATKNRWLFLPPGTAIDASQPDRFEFPPGTRLWKEFRFAGPVETRMIERLADGSWRYAVYAWDSAAGDARLAPADGLRGVSVAEAPGGRYDIPSQDDCRACHEGAAVPVLGFSALQLSPDRDPLAPHAETPGDEHGSLAGFVARGVITGLPGPMLSDPPRIEASSPVERAALGYLHANRGHCHNASGPMLLVDMLLSHTSATGSQAVLDSLLDQPGDKTVFGFDRRVVRGNAGASTLALRMRSRSPILQMPPLGSRVADQAGIALVEAWIQQLSVSEKEHDL